MSDNPVEAILEWCKSVVPIENDCVSNSIEHGKKPAYEDDDFIPNILIESHFSQLIDAHEKSDWDRVLTEVSVIYAFNWAKTAPSERVEIEASGMEAVAAYNLGTFTDEHYEALKASLSIESVFRQIFLDVFLKYQMEEGQMKNIIKSAVEELPIFYQIFLSMQEDRRNIEKMVFNGFCHKEISLGNKQASLFEPFQEEPTRCSFDKFINSLETEQAKEKITEYIMLELNERFDTALIRDLFKQSAKNRADLGVHEEGIVEIPIRPRVFFDLKEEKFYFVDSMDAVFTEFDHTCNDALGDEIDYYIERRIAELERPTDTFLLEKMKRLFRDQFSTIEEMKAERNRCSFKLNSHQLGFDVIKDISALKELEHRIKALEELILEMDCEALFFCPIND